MSDGPQIVSTTDHFKLIEIAQKVDRGKEMTADERDFLWRYRERLELEQPEAGFEDRWD